MKVDRTIPATVAVNSSCLPFSLIQLYDELSELSEGAKLISADRRIDYILGAKLISHSDIENRDEETSNCFLQAENLLRNEKIKNNRFDGCDFIFPTT